MGDTGEAEILPNDKLQKYDIATTPYKYKGNGESWMHLDVTFDF